MERQTLLIKALNCNFRDNLYPRANLIAGKVSMVRGVFQRWNGVRSETLEECFRFYDPIVQAYHAVGIQTLFILTSQTWGDGGIHDGKQPSWIEGGVSWEEYARQKADVALQIVRRYAKYGVVIQEGNEPDVLGIEVNYRRDTSKECFSSIPLSAYHYAIIANTVIKAVRTEFPNQVILSAGLCTGAVSQGNYWNAVTRAIGRELDVTYFATHPYTIYPKSEPKIRGLWTATMMYHFSTLRRFTSKPFFASETGVAADVPFPVEDYGNIALYMRDSYQWMNDNKIAGWCWWSWSDGMVNGGIVDTANRPKQPIYDTFLSLSANVTAPPTTPNLPTVTTIGSVNIRSGRSLKEAVVAGAAKGVTLNVLDSECVVAAFIGKDTEWLKVELQGKTGYIRGDKVRLPS